MWWLLGILGASLIGAVGAVYAQRYAHALKERSERLKEHRAWYQEFNAGREDVHQAMREGEPAAVLAAVEELTKIRARRPLTVPEEVSLHVKGVMRYLSRERLPVFDEDYWDEVKALEGAQKRDLGVRPP